VRLQLACTLGEWDDPSAGESLAQLSTAWGEDPYLAAAVVSSAPRHLDTLARALSGAEASGPVHDGLLSTALGMGNRSALAHLVKPLLTPKEGCFSTAQMRTFGRFLSLLSRAGLSFQAIAQESEDSLADVLTGAPALLQAARATSRDPARGTEERAVSVVLLGWEGEHRDVDLAILTTLLANQIPLELQQAAVAALAATGDPRAPEILTHDWLERGPSTRDAILEALLGRENWAIDLIERIEGGQVGAVDLDAARRDRLINHESEAVRTRAQGALANLTPADRVEVLDEFRSALTLKGDVRRGAVLFARDCATCHRLDDVGREIGPNLGSVTDRSPDGLLRAILDPNANVEPRYVGHACEIVSGEVIYGLVTGESGGSVTMKGLDGATRSFRRAEIKKLVSTNRSLMPAGLEQTLAPQDLADVIEYLKR